MVFGQYTKVTRPPTCNGPAAQVDAQGTIAQSKFEEFEARKTSLSKTLVHRFGGEKIRDLPCKQLTLMPFIFSLSDKRAAWKLIKWKLGQRYYLRRLQTSASRVSLPGQADMHLSKAGWAQLARMVWCFQVLKQRLGTATFFSPRKWSE